MPTTPLMARVSGPLRACSRVRGFGAEPARGQPRDSELACRQPIGALPGSMPTARGFRTSALRGWASPLAAVAEPDCPHGPG